MSPRLAYILRQPFRNKFGVWITDAEISEWLEYLNSQKLKIVEGE